MFLLITSEKFRDICDRYQPNTLQDLAQHIPVIECFSSVHDKQCYF